MTLVDAVGTTVVATTNAAGNFFLTPAVFAPQYPVHVTSITLGTASATMHSHIGGNGSCASCHVDPAGPDSPGHVCFQVAGESPVTRAWPFSSTRIVAFARQCALLGGAVIATLLACTSAPSDARFVATPPDAKSFPPVAAMLIQACGTLDCHGTVGRNLRLYGDTGLRLSLTDVPSTLIPTTDGEVAQNYASIVGLEPELLSAVVASGGMDPERLTFVRKARGMEAHKGGAVVAAGDARDVCITTWLKGHADASSCTAALALP